jgi:hypothetical protein
MTSTQGRPSRYLLASVGHCGRPPDYSFSELQHNDSLEIPTPVAFGLGEASTGGATTTDEPDSEGCKSTS